MILTFSNSKKSMLVFLLLASTFIGQGGGYGKVYPYHIFFIPCFCIVLTNYRKIREHFIILLPVFFFIFYSALSLAWSPDFRFGVVEFLQLFVVSFSMIAVSAVQLSFDQVIGLIKKVIWVNLFISIAESTSVFRYPFSQYSDWAPLLGKAQYDWIPMVTDWPTGFHWNPNNNAFFILITFPLIFFKSSMFQRVLYTALASFCVYMCSSKLIILAWIMVLFFIMIKVIWNGSFKIRLLTLLFSLVACGLLLTISLNTDEGRLEKYSRTKESLTNLVSIVPKILFSRLSGQTVHFNFQNTDVSLHERVTYLDGIFIIIKENFLFGIGAGGLSQRSNTQAGRTVKLQTPHFYIFEIFAKYGVLFVTVFSIWYIYMLQRMRQINIFLFYSLLLILLFSPVIASVSYFLPVWGIYTLVYVEIERASNLSQNQDEILS